MARKRMIDPDFWTDEKLGECSRDERLLFMGLISNADDDGRGRANPKLIKSIIFPYDEDLAGTKIKKMLDTLSKYKFITLYECGQQEFYHVTRFAKHQVINKKIDSKLPPPKLDGTLPEDYGSNTVVIPEDEGLIEVNRKEENRKEIKIKHLDFVHLTEKQYLNLVHLIGDELEGLIFEMNVWLANNPSKQKTTDCNLTLQNWHRRRKVSAVPKKEGKPKKPDYYQQEESYPPELIAQAAKDKASREDKDRRELEAIQRNMESVL